MTDNTIQMEVVQGLRTHSRWRIYLWRFAVVLIVVAMMMHAIVRDRVPILSAIFYAFPLIVISVAATLLAWIGRRVQRSERCSRGLKLLAVVALMAWGASDFRLSWSVRTPPETVRLVFWNVGRGSFSDWDQIAQRLGEFDADVLALVEANADEVQTKQFWQTRLPGYSSLPQGGGIVLLVKGEVTHQSAGTLANAGHFRRMAVDVRGTQFDVIITDIVSDPLRSRQPSLDRLWEIIRAQADRPTVVAGDFNTPPNSVWFDRWREDLTRAWESSGSGYQATWPLPLPVLTLDHVWGNRPIRFHRCVCGWSKCSDHRPVIVDFTVERP